MAKVESPEQLDEDLDGPLKIKRNYALPIMLFLAIAGVIGAVVYFFFLQTKLHPERVLILIEVVSSEGEGGGWWVGGEFQRGSLRDASRKISLGLGEHLDKHGFDAIEPGKRGFLDPRMATAFTGVTDHEKLREIAESFEIGHLIIGSTRIEEPLLLKGSDLTRYKISWDWSVMDVASGEKTPVETSNISLHFSTRSETLLLQNTSEQWGGLILASRVLETLSIQPSIGLMNAGPHSDLPSDIKLAALNLATMFRMVDMNDEEIEAAKKRESDNLRSLLQKEQSPASREPLGSGLDYEVFLGALPNNKILLIKEPHAPLAILYESKYALNRGDEQLIIADPDGKNRKVLHEFYSFFQDTGAVSQDGKWVAVVRDYAGESKEVTVISTETGEVRPLYQHSNDRYFKPSFSPDASMLAIYRRDAQGDFILEVMETQEEDVIPRALGIPMDVRRKLLEPPMWSSDSQYLYIPTRLHSGQRASIWRYRASDGDAKEIIGPDTLPTPLPELNFPAEAFQDGALLGTVYGVSNVPWELEEGSEANFSSPDYKLPPRYSSSFEEVVLSADGATLLLREISPDKETFLSRFDLKTGKYERLIQESFQHIRLSPNGEEVAIEAWRLSNRNPRDPYYRDREVLLVDLETLDTRQLTLNNFTDRFQGWSADGESIYIGVETRNGEQDPCSWSKLDCQISFRVNVKE